MEDWLGCGYTLKVGEKLNKCYNIYNFFMTDIPYSNREIDNHFTEVKTILGRIEAQTIKTNGRVSNLENWRAYTAGAVAMIVLVGVPILGFLAYELYKLAVIIE